MLSHNPFAYDQAFDRNLGWFTEAEQLALRGKRVAIAGMGGVGAVHLLSLVRLGIGAFHIADFDHYDLANFNRQAGATMRTIGRPKAEVMHEMALDINPELRIRRFDQGVNTENLDEFLAGVDLFIDGFDFFVIDMRQRVFARCHERGIPAVTAAPIGMGTGFLAFVPDGMSFEQYFRLDGKPEVEQYLRFLMGLVPRGLHRPYLVDPSRLNLATKTGPSTIAACQLCAGVTTVMAVKLLLRRGDVQPAPWHHHYDAFRGKLVRSWLPFGNNGPIQRLKLALARRAIAAAKRPPAPPQFQSTDPVDTILHAARWAPSGDNEQPWSFEKLGNDTVLVHLAPRNTANPYEYRDGEPITLAGGMLLENLRIAASAQGKRMTWLLEANAPICLRVQFVPDESIVRDPLYAALGLRSVDRGRYHRRPLTSSERAALEAALGGRLRVDWHASTRARWRFARLSARATDIRLRAPETFPIHKAIIDWDVTLSPTKIPAGALGLGTPTLRIMRWAMQDWRRTQKLNRFAGTGSATLEMDYLPILCSGAAFTLRFPTPMTSDSEKRGLEDLLEAGIHIQRFWLTATQAGLAMQPALAILIFAHYGAKEIAFTTDAAVRAKSGALARKFEDVFGAVTDDFVFLGRVGEPLPRMGSVRSTRKAVEELLRGMA